MRKQTGQVEHPHHFKEMSRKLLVSKPFSKKRNWPPPTSRNVYALQPFKQIKHMEATATRNSRKVLVGIVTSRSGDKTIKVTYSFKVPHPLYKKEIKRKTVVHAHDEKNECGIGDKVEIMETRPLSKMKRWRVTRVLEVAPKLGDE